MNDAGALLFKLNIHVLDANYGTRTVRCKLAEPMTEEKLKALRYSPFIDVAQPRTRDPLELDTEASPPPPKAEAVPSKEELREQQSKFHFSDEVSSIKKYDGAATVFLDDDTNVVVQLDPNGWRSANDPRSYPPKIKGKYVIRHIKDLAKSKTGEMQYESLYEFVNKNTTEATDNTPAYRMYLSKTHCRIEKNGASGAYTVLFEGERTPH